MDLVCSVGHSPGPGESVLADAFSTHPGGKGANQAVALARLGAAVHMVGAVGADGYGEEYRHVFRREGVDASLVRENKNEATGLALIILEESAENRIVVVAGANGEVSAEDARSAVMSLPDDSIVLAQLEIPLEAVSAAFVAAKERGFTTILDPAPARPLPRELLSLVDIVTPNQTELEALVGGGAAGGGGGSPGDGGGAAGGGGDTAGRHAYLAECGVKTLVLKAGADGAVVTRLSTDAGPRGTFAVPGFSVDAVDTTAAGDSFNAGLAFALGRGDDLESAVRFACAVGALSCTKLGAQSAMPRLTAVEALVVGD